MVATTAARSPRPRAASPTATAEATATPVPTVSTTSTPAHAFDEVVLGVATGSGARLPNGSRAFGQVVLRNGGGPDWEVVALSVPPRDAGVHGVTFASPTVAFAFGGWSEEPDGMLFRSDDTGRTWRSLSHALPPDCPRIFDAVFADPEVGFIVGRSTFSLPVAFRTDDGGTTWRELVVPPSSGFPLYGAYALGLRAGVPEVVRYDGGGMIIGRLDDPSQAPVILDPSGGPVLAGSNAFSTVGAAGWIAETYDASILRSAAPGEPWVRYPLGIAGFSDLRAIDVRDGQHGVAGGSAAVPARAPLLFVTVDGATWQSATIWDVPDGWTVWDVLRLRGDGAVAVATDITSGESQEMILRSNDGGLSWHREPTPFEHDWEIHDLARNTERP